MASTIVKWHPEQLNRRLLGAFRSSVGDAKNAALMGSPSKTKATARYTFKGPTSAVLATSGKLGHVFELGRQGGYIIQPGLKTVRGRDPTGATRGKVTTGVRAGSGARALKLPWGYAAVAIGGPMRAKPYVKPASVLWARRLYQMRASAALRRGLF